MTITDWLQHLADLTDVGLYAMTLFGAFAMHVFQQYKGFTGSISFLKAVLPGRSDVFYVRLDLVVAVLSGSVIGYVIFAPTAALPALAAGFGWTSAMQTLIKDPDHVA